MHVGALANIDSVFIFDKSTEDLEKMCDIAKFRRNLKVYQMIARVFVSQRVDINPLLELEGLNGPILRVRNKDGFVGRRNLVA
jgi:hypothetical protein